LFKLTCMNKRLPLKCPSCENQLQVQQLHCENCDTVVTGSFSLPVISQLPIEDQRFILDFVKASGSLKIMAQNMKLSYPTVRNILDEIISRINNLDSNE
jgi:hypothetical protein